MFRTSGRALAVVLVTAFPLPFLVASPAVACSVCQAGDPLFSSGGATPQQAGTGSVYFEIQGWRKTSGLLPHAPEEAAHEDEHGEEHHDEHGDGGREVNQGQILSLYVAISPIDRLTLTLHAPWRFNAIVEEPGGEPATRSTLSGFGDLSLTAGYVLWRDRAVLPSTWIEARVFGKFPTGQRVQEVDGNIDPHLQLGTGSWDWGVGLAAGQRASWGTLYASVFQRFNQPGALDYEYGDVTLANLAVEAPLGHLLGAPALDALTPGLELNFRYAGHDRSGGATYADSGGGILYLTPSLRLRLPWFAGQLAPSIRLAAQLPLGQIHLANQQHEGIVWSAGLAIPF